MSYTKSLAPAGVVQAFAGATVPEGWLLCDGSTIAQVDYPELYAALGFTYAGDPGGGNFNLPNFAGRFLRGAGGAAAALGAAQAQATDLVSHGHTIPWGVSGTRLIHNSNNDGRDLANGTYGEAAVPGSVSNTASSSETRPANYAVQYIIKY